MALLNEIQVGPLEKLRDATTCQVGGDGEAPTVRHTLTFTVTTPVATAREVVELMAEGAAVFVVVGTRQHRLGGEND